MVIRNTLPWSLLRAPLAVPVMSRTPAAASPRTIAGIAPPSSARSRANEPLGFPRLPGLPTAGPGLSRRRYDLPAFPRPANWVLQLGLQRKGGDGFRRPQLREQMFRINAGGIDFQQTGVPIFAGEQPDRRFVLRPGIAVSKPATAKLQPAARTLRPVALRCLVDGEGRRPASLRYRAQPGGKSGFCLPYRRVRPWMPVTSCRIGQFVAPYNFPLRKREIEGDFQLH